MSLREFWEGRKVLVTGHTGFKGGWLALWLKSLGASVAGYALAPVHDNGFYCSTRLDDCLQSYIASLLDRENLEKAVQDFQPEVVFHLAAQALVRPSYEQPVDTVSVNVMGTLNLFEAVRECKSVRAIINVTTDKCYENIGVSRGYVEEDRLGGYDPYSASKACSEILSACYRRSFFDDEGRVSLATARAGNVIGGGDWASDRLVPDLVRAFILGKRAILRNPDSVRPWQHVLDPLHGYLLLAQAMLEGAGEFDQAWNFGPDPQNQVTTGEIASSVANAWGKETGWDCIKEDNLHEFALLALDSSKSQDRLGWGTLLGLKDSLEWTVSWYKTQQAGEDMRAYSLRQLAEFSLRTTSNSKKFGG